MSEKTNMLRWWAVVRWFLVVVLFSIGLLHINLAKTIVESVAFITVFAGIVCLNIMFRLQTNIHRRGFMILQVLLDILFATIFVHITGGMNSYFVWVYLIGVITASLTIPRVGGVFAGLAGSFSLMMLAFLYQNNVLNPTETSSLDVTGSIIYILSYTGLFSGVAFISGYLNENCDKNEKLEVALQNNRQQSQSLISAVEELRQSNRKVKELMPVLDDIGQLRHDINTPLCVISLSMSRVKRLGLELSNDALLKSDNEITESLNKISTILQRLDVLNERLALLDEKAERP
jgi:K+-sensing histidine kinase KdpD